MTGTKKEYTVYITITDATSVDAYNEEEAIEIATDIFRENGLDVDRGQFGVHYEGQVHAEI